MLDRTLVTSLRCGLTLAAFCLFTGHLTLNPVWGQTGTLAEPFPAPAPNAALHYQRGILQLATLTDAQVASLNQPIWEVLPSPVEGQLPDELASLLRRGRFAVQSAATGSRLAECNFGIDFSEAGASAQLPHVEGMLHLGRLLTLRGVVAEVQGDWEEAAIIYFDGLRLGRHLTHQSTLLEALVGVEILRNNYFALSRWASRCPSRPLVARAFGLVESMQESLVQPSQILARETGIMALEFDQLQRAYPNGNWAEMILNSVDAEVTGDREKDAMAAKQLCIERGIPESTFASTKEFRVYVGKLRATAHRFAESVTACMTLPPQARIERAAALNKKYASLIPLFAEETLIDPVEIGTLMAEHEAELVVTRLGLALAASRTDGKFPATLSEVESRFGGDIPLDPYSGQGVVYTVLEDGQHFELAIPGVAGFPAVKFSSLAPAAAE